MTFNPEIHHRHSIRLPNYDYSQPGYYFVTLCAHERECSFGKIEDNKIVLNETGMLVYRKWHGLPDYFPGVELDQMVIMPNHLHGIIIILDRRKGGVLPPLGIIPPYKDAITSVATAMGATTTGDDRGVMTTGATTAPLQKRKTLGQMIAWFKYESTKEINRIITDNPDMKIWQRNFYERIVRNDEELNRIRNYIDTNPETWLTDENYI